MSAFRHRFKQRALISSALLFCAPLLFLHTVFYAHAVAAASPCAMRQFDEVVNVAKVYDGDTIRLTDGRKIRLIGINAPELAKGQRPAEPLATAARQALQSLLSRTAKIGLIKGIDQNDRYGRVLAHIFAQNGENITATLIARGFGFAISVAPNVRLQRCYFSAEASARARQAGIWNNPYYLARLANKLTDTDKGFRLVRGEVTGIGRGKKNIWLDLGERFAIKISQRDLHYFSNMSINSLLHKTITVRGWVGYYRGKYRIRVRHPSMMEIKG